MASERDRLLELLKAEKSSSPRFYGAYLATVEDGLTATAERICQIEQQKQNTTLNRHLLARIHHGAASDLEDQLGPMVSANSELNLALAKLATQAIGTTDGFVERTHTAVKSLLLRKQDQILEDIRKQHTASTNVKDAGTQLKKAGKKAKGWFKKKWEKATDQEVLELGESPPEPDETFLGKIISQRMGGEAINEDIVSVLEAETKTTQADWEDLLQTLSENLQHRIADSQWSFERLDMKTTQVVGDDMALGAVALGSAVGSTLVLAAGWHTLAWSAGSLLLPALPLVALATVATAWFTKDRTREKYETAAIDAIESIRGEISLRVEMEIRPEIRRVNWELQESAGQTMQRALLGDGQADRIDAVLSAMHVLIRRHREEARRLLGLDDKPGGEQGLVVLTEPEREAKRRHEAGDDFAAVVFAALGFEKFIKELQGQHAHDFVFAGERFFQRFIETLQQRQVVDATTARTMTYLRRKRNEAIHHMDRLAMMTDDARARYVGEFLEQLQSVRRQCQA